jgi:alpha-tubulin suppressor-like RCC1 family protein
MSDKSKNIFRLNKVYDLIKSGLLPYSDNPLEFGGELWSWGDPNRTFVSCQEVPVKTPGNQWIDVCTSSSHSHALKNDGTLWAWGDNCRGKLGDGTIISRNQLVQVPGNQWSLVSSKNFSTLGIKTDGTLWSWGYGGNGRLGDNTIINRSSPVQIPGTQWNDVSAGDSHSLARKTDGTLWAWGLNTSGRLGDGTIIQKSSPVQIPGIAWNDISTFFRSAARKTDGTLWTWGDNSSGGLGTGDTAHRSSPVQIPGTQWSCISIGANHSHALKTDGTLWSWGYDASSGIARGRLGINCGGSPGVTINSPVQIPGTQWCFTEANNYGGVALKTDGTHWAWGINLNSQLGVIDIPGGLQYASSPVQVLGTQWAKVSINKSISFGNGHGIRQLTR